MNILLLVVDCLRYDHARLFSETLARMPNRVCFDNAWSVAPMSDPNFASILTGTHPDTHGVLTQCMETDCPTIALALQLAEWDTFGASVWYSDGKPAGGLPEFYRRGFGEWEWLPWNASLPVGQVWRTLQNTCEPWLAMLRPMDLHERGAHEYDYAAVAAELDKDLACLLDIALAKFPDTVIILTADHGQGLGERDMWHHREHLWWFLTHVPQVWAHPSFIAGECHSLVQHMDLTATVAGLAGVEFPSEGVDWSGYLTTGELPKLGRDHVVMSSLGSEHQTDFNLSELWLYRTIRKDGWVLHVDYRKGETRRRLYHAAVDPLGEHDLSGRCLRKMAELETQMGWPSVPGVCEFDVLERLRAIGYAD